MNKTYNVNVGGYPFTMDINAYERLESYLDIIENHFSASESCEEIVNDIELRFAELIHERPNKQPIVNLRDVEVAIKILGTPEEFGAESDTLPDDDYIQTEKQRRSGKRLFRNKEDKVWGGVCSGLAAYFGVADPVWIRLFFVLLTLSTGMGLIAYIVLMLIVPYAKTNMDKLAMQGETINVENIARSFEHSIDELSVKIDNLSEKFKSKKKS
jgi:phage shock protein PspC (stress-responsive transcriptional regulator)